MDELASHPAARAWKELEPKAPAPVAIVGLEELPGQQVYRLVGVGPGGTSVVAKRRR
jgi:hypothetical protein